jgi:hypothetical protein
MDIKEFVKFKHNDNLTAASKDLGISLGSLCRYMTGERIPSRRPVIRALQNKGIDTIRLPKLEEEGEKKK